MGHVVNPKTHFPSTLTFISRLLVVRDTYFQYLTGIFEEPSQKCSCSFNRCVNICVSSMLWPSPSAQWQYESKGNSFYTAATGGLWLDSCHVTKLTNSKDPIMANFFVICTYPKRPFRNWLSLFIQLVLWVMTPLSEHLMYHATFEKNE